MDDIKEIISELTNDEKQELLNYIKLIINNEFDNFDENVCECYKCHSREIVKLGKYNGMQRYRCNKCSVSFTAKSRTIFATTKLKKEVWLKYIESFIDCLSLRRCAEKVGVGLKTSYFMRHRILECLKQNNSQFIINSNNKGQLDETLLRENFKGNHSKSTNFTMPRDSRKNGQASKLIGCSNEQICIASGINDTNHVFFDIAGRGQLTNDSLTKILQNKIMEGSIISTDKRSNYKTVLKLFNVGEHNAYKSSTKDAYQNLGNINSLHSRFKEFIRKMHGVATRRLDNYLAWFSWIENFKRNEQKDKLIIESLTSNKYTTSIRDYKNTPYLYMEYWNVNQDGLT
ncbi:MAG: IS1595 family transposase [Bacilli bacterium]